MAFTMALYELRIMRLPRTRRNTPKLKKGADERCLATRSMSGYYVAGVGDIVEATVKGQPERIELVAVKRG